MGSAVGGESFYGALTDAALRACVYAGHVFADAIFGLEPSGGTSAGPRGIHAFSPGRSQQKELSMHFFVTYRPLKAVDRDLMYIYIYTYIYEIPESRPPSRKKFCYWWVEPCKVSRWIRTTCSCR